MFWRRKQETMNDPTDHSPIEQDDGAKTYAEVVRDREAAEQAISDARSDEPAPKWEQKWLAEEASGLATGATGEEDTEQTVTGADVNPLPPHRYGGRALPEYGRTIDKPISAPQPSRNILAGSPVAGRSPVPVPLVTAEHQTCVACDGRGVMPNISDLLRESASWIDDMDGVIVAFYRRFLDIVRAWAEMKAKLDGADEWQQRQAGEDAVADAAFLFPPDLLSARGETATRGTAQRDKLAEALVGLSALYDPTDAEAVEKLDNVIKSMANRHNAFVRRNGTVRAATGLEFAFAGVALLDTLATLGDRFTPAHAEAWSIAYDFTSGGMLQHQQRSGFTSPRFPRV